MRKYLVVLVLLSACSHQSKEKDEMVKSLASGSGKAYLAQEFVSTAATPNSCPSDMSETSFRKNEWQKQVGILSACYSTQKNELVRRYAGFHVRQHVGSPWSDYFLALQYSDAKEYDKSLWSLNQAHDKAGQDVALYTYQEARIHYLRGDLPLCLEKMRQVIKLDSGNEGALYFLGEISEAKGAFEDALKWYQKIPQHASSYKYLSSMQRVHRKLGQNSEAQKIEHQLKSLRPAKERQNASIQ